VRGAPRGRSRSSAGTFRELQPRRPGGTSTYDGGSSTSCGTSATGFEPARLADQGTLGQTPPLPTGRARVLLARRQGAFNGPAGRAGGRGRRSGVWNAETGRVFSGLAPAAGAFLDGPPGPSQLSPDGRDAGPSGYNEARRPLVQRSASCKIRFAGATPRARGRSTALAFQPGRQGTLAVGLPVAAAPRRGQAAGGSSVTSRRCSGSTWRTGKEIPPVRRVRRAVNHMGADRPCRFRSWRFSARTAKRLLAGTGFHRPWSRSPNDAPKTGEVEGGSRSICAADDPAPPKPGAADRFRPASRRATLTDHEKPRRLGFRRFGPGTARTFATGGADGMVMIWDAATPQEGGRSFGAWPPASVNRCSRYSPDGKFPLAITQLRTGRWLVRPRRDGQVWSWSWRRRARTPPAIHVSGLPGPRKWRAGCNFDWRSPTGRGAVLGQGVGSNGAEPGTARFGPPRRPAPKVEGLPPRRGGRYAPGTAKRWSSSRNYKVDPAMPLGRQEPGQGDALDRDGVGSRVGRGGDGGPAARPRAPVTAVAWVARTGGSSPPGGADAQRRPVGPRTSGKDPVAGEGGPARQRVTARSRALAFSPDGQVARRIGRSSRTGRTPRRGDPLRHQRPAKDYQDLESFFLERRRRCRSPSRPTARRLVAALRQLLPRTPGKMAPTDRRRPVGEIQVYTLHAPTEPKGRSRRTRPRSGAPRRCVEGPAGAGRHRPGPERRTPRPDGQGRFRPSGRADGTVSLWWDAATRRKLWAYGPGT